MVPANIRMVFQALNEICSVGGGGLISAVVDNWSYRSLHVFKIMLRHGSVDSLKDNGERAYWL